MLGLRRSWKRWANCGTYKGGRLHGWFMAVEDSTCRAEKTGAVNIRSKKEVDMKMVPHRLSQINIMFFHLSFYLFYFFLSFFCSWPFVCTLGFHHACFFSCYKKALKSPENFSFSLCISSEWLSVCDDEGDHLPNYCCYFWCCCCFFLFCLLFCFIFYLFIYLLFYGFWVLGFCW